MLILNTPPTLYDILTTKLGFLKAAVPAIALMAGVTTTKLLNHTIIKKTPLSVSISHVTTVATAAGLLALAPPSALLTAATLIGASTANLFYQCLTQ